MFTLVPTAMAEGEMAEAPAVTKVAKVGNVEYATLAEAVEAVPTDSTETEIVLLKDYIGSGIKVVAGKNIVFNLNGKTYTVDKPTVGSSGTETNGFQLLKDSKVTFKNGTLDSATGADSLPNGGILIQNYCDLTLENVTLDTSANSNISYVISNNFGSLTAKGNTVIKAADGKVAFDLWYGMNSNGLYDDGVSVTFGTDFTGSVTGKIEYGAHSRVPSNSNWKDKARLTIANGNFDTTFVDSNNNDGVAPEDFNITIIGGTFSSDVSAYVPNGYIQNENGAVETLGETNAVAKVGDTYYKTLPEAVAAAQNGETVTLLEDVTENVTIPTDKTITLDLNGKTLSGGKNNDKAALLNEGTVTIKDSSATKTGTIKREDDADKTGTSYYVIKNLGTMTIEQANVNNNSGYKETNSAGSMKGSSLICNGDRADDNETTLTINDGVFEQQNFLAVKNGAMGILNVNGGKFTSKHSAIQNWYKADIKGGEINGQLWTDAFTWAPNGVSAGETKISGTTKFTGEIVMDITGSVKPTLEISGGEMNVTNWRITSAAANAGAKPVITGGLFSSEPAEKYIAENHYVDASNNGDYPYTVKEGTKPAGALIVVKDTTAVTVPDSEAIKGLTNDDKTNIANKSSVDGVAEAIADNKADLIPADVNTTDAKKVEIEVTVKVNVTSADMTSENKTLTFEASPVATVTVTKADGSTEVKNDVKVPNSLLNDEITVKLPLPAGFTPKQIKHISSDGSVEYFLKTAKRGAKLFTVDSDNCAVFTITKFSTFELSGTVTYVEPSYYSGSSSDPTYSVTVDKTENGSVTVSPKSASKGDTVTVTVKPDSGYVLETLTVTDKNGNELTLKDKGDGKYTFTMPAGKVEVKATFMEDNSVLNFFYDVPNDAFFYEAVKWAVKSGVTNGLSDTMFGPYESCTRAQIVTFLWRAAGSPEPKTASSFTDVPANAYYAKAVAWAVENGITNGMTATMFAPDATCTRGQSVTFLHRALKGTASSSANFTDVKSDAFYADAINWAVANNVTNGTSNTTFSPDADCTRAEIVTFLYRAYQGK